MLVASLLVTSVVAAADPRRPRALESDEVRGQMKAVDAEIGRCYLDTVGDRRGAGHLEITLTIHRTGILDDVAVATPNLPAKLETKIAACVEQVVTGFVFPARRAGTTAVLPYFYQRTAAPGAGPQYSCWNPKGC